MGSHMRLDICHVLFYEHVSVAVGFVWEKDSVAWMWMDVCYLDVFAWQESCKCGRKDRVLCFIDVHGHL